MVDEMCRKCGEPLVEIEQCAKCKETVQQVCSACRKYTVKKYHAFCAYYLRVLELFPYSH